MDPKVLFKKALEQATATIKCVENRHFKNSTPCADWDCRALVNHLLYELSWVPDLLMGQTIAQVGKKYDGDLLGKNHISNWLKAADRAIIAVNKTDLKKTVHLSYGDVLASDYLTEVGTDLLIHAWDVAQSFSCSLIMEPELAQSVYEKVQPRKHEYANSGLFGKPIDTDASARLQTKLLAILGRREPVL